MSERDGNFEIYVMDANGENQQRLTDNAAQDWRPAWSPDGTKLIFPSGGDINLQLFIINADGSNLLQLTHNSARNIQPSWWSAPTSSLELTP
jgi:Tol biopolymer transport system component